MCFWVTFSGSTATLSLRIVCVCAHAVKYIENNTLVVLVDYRVYMIKHRDINDAETSFMNEIPIPFECASIQAYTFRGCVDFASNAFMHACMHTFPNLGLFICFVFDR